MVSSLSMHSLTVTSIQAQNADLVVANISDYLGETVGCVSEFLSDLPWTRWRRRRRSQSRGVGIGGGSGVGVGGGAEVGIGGGAGVGAGIGIGGGSDH